MVNDMTDMSMRLDVMEQHSTSNGRLVWKITNFSERLHQAQNGTTPSLYSPHFYTHPQGYKLCLRMYPNGDGSGKNTHLSLFIAVMQTEYDAILSWPMNKKITFRVWDQTVAMPHHCVEVFGTGGSGSSFIRPATYMNVASGIPKMLPLDQLEPGSRFLKHDTLYIECNVSDIAGRTSNRSH